MANKEKKFDSEKYWVRVLFNQYQGYLVEFRAMNKSIDYFDCQLFENIAMNVPTREKVIEILEYNNIEEFDFEVEYDTDEGVINKYIYNVEEQDYPTFIKFGKEEYADSPEESGYWADYEDNEKESE